MEVVIACLLLALFCTSCTLVGSINVAPMPDPFAKPPRGSVGRQSVDDMAIEAIMDANDRPHVALLCDGEHVMLARGGKIKGFTVKAIEQDRIVLVKGRTERILHIN